MIQSQCAYGFTRGESEPIGKEDQIYASVWSLMTELSLNRSDKTTIKQVPTLRKFTHGNLATGGSNSIFDFHKRRNDKQTIDHRKHRRTIEHRTIIS